MSRSQFAKLLDKVGTSSSPVPEVNTEQLSIGNAAAVAYPTSDQTVSDTTVEKMQIDTKEVEHTKVLSIDLANNNITVEEGGGFLVSVEGVWASGAGWTTGDFAVVTLRVNGTDVMNANQRKIGTEVEGKRSIYISDLAQGDVITGKLWQNSGADKTLGGAQKKTRIQVVKLW